MFPGFDGEQVLKALDLDLRSFVPDDDDRDTLRSIARVIITRILSRNVTHFKTYKSGVTWHIPHERSAESAQKSKVVRRHSLFFHQGALIMTGVRKTPDPL